MRRATLVVDGAAVAPVLVADTFATRLRGMLGRRPLPPALVLTPSGSVHGVGMSVSLDVALVGDDEVVRGVEVLRPFGLTRPHRGATWVVEAPVGSFAAWGLTPGSRVSLRDPQS